MLDAGTAKKLIEKNLSYDEVKRLTVKLVQHASPQTRLLEAEPQVLALIQDVIRPELEQSGLKPFLDKMGNLILRLKGRQPKGRLMLVGYAMCAAPSTMENPYSGEIVDGAPYKLDGECVWGRGACEQKGSLAAMMAAVKFIGATRSNCPAISISSSAPPARPASTTRWFMCLDHGNVEADWCIIDGPPEIQLGNKGPGRCASRRQRQAGAQQPAMGRHQRHRWRDEGAGEVEALDADSGRQTHPESRQSQLDHQRHREFSQGDPHDPERVPHHVRPPARCPATIRPKRSSR